jgi:trehalose-6-phosphate synthase
MRFTLRFGAPLLVALALLVLAVTPLADNLIGQWFQRDLQLRSRLIFNVVEPALTELVRDGSSVEIRSLFDGIAQDERVLSLAWCRDSTKQRVVGRTWPRDVDCDGSAEETEYRTVHHGGATLLLATFPLGNAAERLGRVLILHDASFIGSRSAIARFYLVTFLGLVGAVATIVTMITARLTLRDWLRTMRHQVTGGLSTQPHDPALDPMLSEIRQLVRDLDHSPSTSTHIRVDWSPDTLRGVLKSELSNSQIIVVSNREPYIHNRDDHGNVLLQRPASGMVTALEPVMRACGGTWIAHGSGTADRDVSDRGDRVAVPPHDPSYSLRRVWLSEQEQDGYYYGLANEGLWPLCHITFVRPSFRESDWLQYYAVNQKFAEAVVKEANRPDPVVLVQDYHFALLPKMIRQRLPNAVIITFWHIPWPNPEVFGICPWRQQILEGLLGSSIIGFHTQLHCNNFIEAADRFIECHIDREETSVSVGGHNTLVRPYPISIAWPPEALEHVPPVDECRARVLQLHNLPADTNLAVGVERFDFTKGIPDRFKAVEILLETHPELIGKFVLLQAAAPSRSKLPAYAGVQQEAVGLAEQINARFGTATYQPIILHIRHHEPEEVFELFRAGDICIVSSLHDGMNLVAKEFVAARDDERGVLVLSSFAGASRELMEALIVNPFDAKASADAIFRAIRMSTDEQERRMRLMRALVSENNIYFWAGRMLLDAARIRKRQQLETAIAVAKTGKTVRA